MRHNTQYTNLPHLDMKEHYQFITFRTKESLDNYLKKLYASNEPKKIKQYKMDQYLDRSPQGAFLYGSLLEKIINYYQSYDQKHFELYAVSIMPNHIHVLLKQLEDMTTITRTLKGGSAHIINVELGRKGKVWSSDYYDKLIRDQEHFDLVYEYIKNNALKAGLADADKRFYGAYE